MDRRVLHICLQPSPETENIASTLAELNVDCTCVADCYAGMAELVRQGPDSFEAVLVCLDGLSLGDREFFQIASRRFRSSSIYVYGSESGEITVSWAVQAGARAEIDAEQLRPMFQQRPVDAPEQSRATRKADPPKLDDLLVDQIVKPLEEQVPPAEGKTVGDPAEDGDAPPDEMSTGHPKSGQTTPRLQPMRSPQSDRTAAPDRASLITPEELHALLGDDAGHQDDSNLNTSGDDK